MPERVFWSDDCPHIVRLSSHGVSNTTKTPKGTTHCLLVYLNSLEKRYSFVFNSRVNLRVGNKKLPLCILKD